MTKLFRNWIRTLGAPEDPVATDTTSEWSLMSLVKALYQKISDGSFAAAVTGRAESLVALCQAAALGAQQSVGRARTYANTASAAATTASTAAATAQSASQSGAFAAGHALLGQRAHKDRVAAEAAQAAAEAAAASVVAEGLVLGIQVYS